MLTASGANFGYRRTLPHLLGVEAGMVALFSAGAFGLGLLFEWMPSLHFFLKILGALFLLYLAYRIATSRKLDNQADMGKPLTLFEAAAFQFINPKGLVITITTMSAWTTPGEAYLSSVILLIIVFASVAFVTMSLWALFGTIIGRFLKEERIYKIFNFTMAALLAMTVVYIIQ